MIVERKEILQKEIDKLKTAVKELEKRVKKLEEYSADDLFKDMKKDISNLRNEIKILRALIKKLLSEN